MFTVETVPCPALLIHGQQPTFIESQFVAIYDIMSTVCHTETKQGLTTTGLSESTTVKPQTLKWPG